MEACFSLHAKPEAPKQPLPPEGLEGAEVEDHVARGTGACGIQAALVTLLLGHTRYVYIPLHQQFSACRS